MEHTNSSGFEALLYPALNREGRETAVAIVRATFDVTPDGGLEPAADQIPVRLEDRWFAEPGLSTSLEESDLAVYKPTTDVIVVGAAHAPGGRPAATVDVAVRVGQVQKAARVTGDRIHERVLGIGPTVPSRPIPFVTLPLVWERTFGGVDPHTADGDRVAFEPRNPIGCGYLSNRVLHAPIPGQKLPNILQLNENGSTSSGPCGFSAVGRGWVPRYRLAGTYDERWREQRAPFLPLDFSYEFFQHAPSDLRTASHIRGDEPVAVVNMAPEGDLAFNLPGLVMGLTVRVDGKPAQRCLAALDTVILEPACRRVSLVWRRAIACRRSAAEVHQVISFAVSRKGAAHVIGSDVDRPIGEPMWMS